MIDGKKNIEIVVDCLKNMEFITLLLIPVEQILPL